MRKSLSKERARLVGAGLASGAVVAALLVAPAAALAATVGTVTPAIAAPSAIGVKLIDTSITSTSVVEITSATSCPSTYTTAGANSTSPWAPTQANHYAADATDNVSFTVPTAVTPATYGVLKSYQVCAYVGSVNGTSALQSSGTLTVGVVPTLYPNVGAIATANPLTITGGTNGAIFSSVTAPYAVFTTSACPSTYGTSPTNTAAINKSSDSVGTVTVPTTVTSATAASANYNVCVYNGNSSTSTLLSYMPYSAVVAVPSQNSGPINSANGPSITFTANSAIFAGLTNVYATFNTAAACPVTYTTPDGTTIINVPTVRKMADNKIAFSVPSLSTNNTTFQACIYGGNANGTSALLAGAPYTTTTVQSTTGITPGAGPALGGNKITIAGIALPQAAGMISATLGGTPLTDITPQSATAFTATAPQHAPGSATLVVTTPAGVSIQSGAYNYTNALKISPNSAPSSAANVDLTVDGVGFLSANWAANTATLAGAHIYLVRGVYDPSSDGSAARANAPVADCTGFLVLSDTELACGLQLNSRLDAAGAAAYTPPAPVPLTGFTTVNGSRYVSTSASLFNKMMVGMMIGSTNLQTNTKIVTVIDDKHALVSANAIAGGSTDGNAIAVAASSIRTTTTNLNAAGTPTISGGVTSADATAKAYGPDLGGAATPAALTITSATALGANVAGPAVSSEPLVVYVPATSLPVPDGPYNVTFVSNGSVDANSTDPTYQQSAVSSTSTFTVAPF